MIVARKRILLNFPQKNIIMFTDSGKESCGCSGFCSIIELKRNPHIIPDGNFYKQLSEQLRKLFNNKPSSDVKIRCGNEEFYCHKILLSARSPVFEAMFQNDMIENHSEEVRIQDIKPEVVKEMLHFIYTGVVSTENVMDEIGKDLFGAADQYQLETLKNKCEEKLCSSLEVSNSIELLVLAELHKAYKLRRMALRIVTRNMDTIVDTDVYEELVKHHPGLTMEITRSLVKK